MKSYRILVISTLILSLLFANGLAFAAGPNPPAPLSQSTTPTATHQVFMPLAASGDSETQASEASAPARSPLSIWLLGIVALVVVVIAYVVLRMGARRRK